MVACAVRRMGKMQCNRQRNAGRMFISSLIFFGKKRAAKCAICNICRIAPNPKRNSHNNLWTNFIRATSDEIMQKHFTCNALNFVMAEKLISKKWANYGTPYLCGDIFFFLARIHTIRSLRGHYCFGGLKTKGLANQKRA